MNENLVLIDGEIMPMEEAFLTTLTWSSTDSAPNSPIMPSRAAVFPDSRNLKLSRAAARLVGLAL